MPVQGADADLGPTRDVLERRLGAALGERLPGGGDQLVVVALGVRAPTRARLVRAARFGRAAPDFRAIGRRRGERRLR